MSADPDLDAFKEELSQTSDPDLQAFKDELSKKDAPSFDKQGRVIVPRGTPGILGTAATLVGQNLSGLGANILGGFKGLKSLAMGKGGQQAGQDVENYVREHTITPAPETAGGQISGALASGYNPMTWPSRFAGAAGEGTSEVATKLGASPEVAGGLGTAVNTGIQAVPLVLGFKGAQMVSAAQKAKAALPPELQATQQALNQSYAGKSAGAASTAPDLTNASPELKQAIADSLKKGETINPEALDKWIKADSLPVRVKFTKGQILGDVDMISDEMNKRGASGGAKFFKDQNDALVANLEDIRNTIGEDVHTTTPDTHGDTLINAYKEKDAPIIADIRAKYKALEDANGGTFPMDTPAFINNVDAALSKKLKTNSVPADIASNLNDFRNGRQMTFEDYETMRSDAADAMRTSTDGRQRAAARIVRDQLEALPMPPGAENLKPLADAARSANYAREQALKADPAYEAAVNNDVTPDKFVSKFITSANASRDSVAKMAENLADNPVASQTMGVATLDHLKEVAGIDRNYQGNLSQSRLNKEISHLAPKMKYIYDPATNQTLENLGEAARISQFRPKGSYVNESNTMVAGLKNLAGTAVEDQLNAVTPGIRVGTKLRESLDKRSMSKEFEKSTAVGAGISEPTKLSTLMKQKGKK